LGGSGRRRRSCAGSRRSVLWRCRAYHLADAVRRGVVGPDGVGDRHRLAVAVLGHSTGLVETVGRGGDEAAVVGLVGARVRERGGDDAAERITGTGRPLRRAAGDEVRPALLGGPRLI
jgi:hypothetical protein